MSSKSPPNKNLHDAIAEELDGVAETASSLLETNPDFDSPDAFAPPEGDFDMGAETRMVSMTPDMQRALEAGITLGADKLDAIPPGLGAQLDFGDHQIALTKALTIIGRVKEVSDISLPDDDQISRHHAAVTYVRGSFFIEDLESTNGTFVDGRRIKRMKLEAGMPVRVGLTQFKLSFKE